MKLTKVAYLLVFALVMTMAASGCRKKPTYLTPLPKGPGATIQDPDRGNPLKNNQEGGIEGSDENITAIPDPNLRKDWPRDREILKAHTVYFDFDQSAVKESERSKLAAVADYLKSHAEDAVEIEGHCDERGTEGYNDALGERRATSLRDELIRLGVDPMRIDTLSLGERKPAATGRDEAAYRQNRRGEFVVEKHP